MAQSLLPGILQHNEQSSLCEYGSVDDGKTIQSNEEYKPMMDKISDIMNIKPSKVKDHEGKEYEMSGSPEVKGIKGTDSRKYLLDLIRMVPRDANFNETRDHDRLLRRELLMIKQRKKNLTYARSKMEDHPKEAPTELTKPAEDASEEEKKTYAQERQKELAKF